MAKACWSSALADGGTARTISVNGNGGLRHFPGNEPEPGNGCQRHGQSVPAAPGRVGHHGDGKCQWRRNSSPCAVQTLSALNSTLGGGTVF